MENLGGGGYLYIDPKVDVHRAVNLAEGNLDGADDRHVVRQTDFDVALHLDLPPNGVHAHVERGSIASAGFRDKGNEDIKNRNNT